THRRPLGHRTPGQGWLIGHHRGSSHRQRAPPSDSRRVAPGSVPETVVIGWKVTREAARAVTAALPFLQIAKQIVIITVAEDRRAPGEEADRLMAGLRWHGVPVSVRHLQPEGQGAADTLLTA